MKLSEVIYSRKEALVLDKFREMDYYAVSEYQLSIELMMENAGLHLASLIASIIPKDQSICIGVGNGNNGGGGLVAARRLSAWGYHVHLDCFTDINKKLPLLQLERALKFGVQNAKIESPGVWVDSYLGFSQRLPLNENLLSRIEEINKKDVMRISLDIPTGFLGDTSLPYFKAEKVLTLAAPKKILYNLDNKTEVLIADLGIPKHVYDTFDIKFPPFHKSRILKLKR